jgi:hypothetical protein
MDLNIGILMEIFIGKMVLLVNIMMDINLGILMDKEFVVKIMKNFYV